MKRRRICVLMGGLSAEREVSLDSGRNVADALRSLGHDVHTIDPGADLLALVRDLQDRFTHAELQGGGTKVPRPCRFHEYRELTNIHPEISLFCRV